jgi:ligand-binding sensor domain-containing protein
MKRRRILLSLVTAVSLLAATSGPALAGAGACPGTWRILTAAPSGSISAIEELPDGRVVAGTTAGGLRVYGPNAQGIYQWSVILASPGGLASNRVKDLAIFKGELWVATADSGIGVQNLETGAWRTIDVASSSLPSDTVNRLTVVPGVRGSSNPSIAESSVWASTPAGAAHYHRVSLGGGSYFWIWTVIDETDGLPDQDVLDVAVHDMQGERSTWFATATKLIRWDGTTFTDASNHCDMTTATRIVVDGRNDIWLNGIREVPALAGGTWVPVGVCRARPGLFGTLGWTHFPEQYGWDMSVDGAGRLWLAQAEIEHTGGAALHDQDSWCVFDATEVPLFSNNVYAAGAIGEVAWYGHGDAAKVSTFTRNWSIVTTSDLGGAGLPGPLLLYLDLTYAGVGPGLSMKVGDDPNWFHDDLDGNQAQVTALHRSGSRLWIGTAGNGILERDETTGVVSQVAGLPDANVREIRADYTGRLWVATAGGLAVRGNGYWLTFDEESSALPSDDVRALRFDTLGRLWVGTAQGIVILDPEADVSPEDWTQVGTAEGLPSAAVTSLAVQPNGLVWVGTEDASAARWDPAASQWTLFGASNGALPDDRVTSIISSIGGGKLWIGTAGGLVLHDGGAWRRFHVPGSTLASDWIRHMAADGKVLLASAGASIAVRADLEGPLGNFYPEIDSVVPAQGAPDTAVTIHGDHFDPRGPEFNTVTIGLTEALSSRKAPAAEIVSVTKTTLQFKVPQLAKTGRIRVTANCLSTETPGDFDIAPRIDSFSPGCVGPGESLLIRGAGFAGFGACDVQIGSGEWRTPILSAPDNQGVDWIRVRARPGDTTGKVRVRNGNGLVAVSAQTVTVGTLQATGRRIQQAIHGAQLIWGKRTLVHLDLDGNGCSTQVDGGVLYWKKTDGSKVRGGIAYAASPGGTSVPLGGGVTVDGNFGGLDYIAEFESNRSGQTPFFSLTQFGGMELVVKNNGVDVLTVTIPASEADFLEMGQPIRFWNMAVVPPSNGTQNDEFWSRAFQGWAHAARIYPQQDVAWYGNTGLVRVHADLLDVRFGVHRRQGR